jgi:hypothetical protein
MPKHTAHTIDDPDEFAHQLQVAAKKGYATDEGEQEIGVHCVAVAATAGMSGSADPATCTPVPTTTARDPGRARAVKGRAGRPTRLVSPAVLPVNVAAIPVRDVAWIIRMIVGTLSCGSQLGSHRRPTRGSIRLSRAFKICV